MIKAVRAEPEADEELRAAARWYEGKRLGLGRDFLAAIGAAIEVLQQHPAGGSRVPRVKRTLPVRRLILRRFPYSVVFLELEAEIRILAFAHHRRRPGYWLKRIRS